MNTKNMFFVLSLVVAGFAGMGLNAQAHEVEEVNEWNKRLVSGELSPEAEKDALLRIAAISTPEYVARERVVNLMHKKFAELAEKESLCGDPSRFLILSTPCREAVLLKAELHNLHTELRPLCDKAIETDAYQAWYNNFGK